MARSWRPNYSTSEVRALIESYTAFQGVKNTSGFGLHLLVVFADLDNALSRLPKWELRVVLLHGLLGIPRVEELFDMDRDTLLSHYRVAIQRLTDHLNGSEAEIK